LTNTTIHDIIDIMAKYKETDKAQGMFLEVNLSEQILPGTFEWAMSRFIDTQADFSGFDMRYNNDLTGAPAIHPRVMLKAVLYGYSKGQKSSRKIQKLCEENITMKALTEDTEPYFTTIARFVSGNEKEITKLFTEVLYFCNELKLIGGDMFAIDGCRLPSNASKEWSGTKKELKKKREKIAKLVEKLVKQHEKEDREKGGGQGEGTDGKFEEQIKRYKKQIEKLDKFDKKNDPRMGSRGKEVQSNITDNESAKIKGPHGVIQGYNGIAIADGKNQIIVAAEAFGGVHEGEHFSSLLGKLDDTMKDLTGKKAPLKGKVMLGDTGYYSEDNLQAAKAKKMEAIIPDPHFRQREDEMINGKYGEYHEKARFDSRDFKYDKKGNSYTCPNGKKLKFKKKVKLNSNEGNRYEASAKDCSACPLREKCMRAGKAKYRVLYIPIPKYGENLCDKMKDKIDRPEVRKIYGQRMRIIEPVFSDITYCKGMDRFTLRGKSKVNIQWLLYCIVHNLGKCAPAMGMEYAV
jgi:transposase